MKEQSEFYFWGFRARRLYRFGSLVSSIEAFFCFLTFAETFETNNLVPLNG